MSQDLNNDKLIYLGLVETTGGKQPLLFQGDFIHAFIPGPSRLEIAGKLNGETCPAYKSAIEALTTDAPAQFQIDETGNLMRGETIVGSKAARGETGPHVLMRFEITVEDAILDLTPSRNFEWRKPKAAKETYDWA